MEKCPNCGHWAMYYNIQEEKWKCGCRDYLLPTCQCTHEISETVESRNSRLHEENKRGRYGVSPPCGVDGLKGLLDKAKTYLDLQVYYKEIFDSQVWTDRQKLERIASLQLAEKSKWILEKDVVEFFKDKVVVDRQQLSDILDKFPRDNIYHCTECGHNACVSISYNQEKWLADLKELLRVYCPHFREVMDRNDCFFCYFKRKSQK